MSSVQVDNNHTDGSTENSSTKYALSALLVEVHLVKMKANIAIVDFPFCFHDYFYLLKLDNL